MILSAFHGFCMALADSVPGVSGGTIAFILGFYDRFLDALHGLFGKDDAARKDAVRYLLKLGLGWVIGMGTCVLVLSQLFAAHIYFMSSLFLGLTLTSFPLVVRAEADVLRGRVKNLPFAALGLALVVGLTLLRDDVSAVRIQFTGVHVWTLGYLFVSGAVAITAMVLPGISGSTLLLIFGIYVPIITAIKDFLHLNFSAFPTVFVFGLGVLTGIVAIIKIIRNALDKHRAATVYLIIGLMIGSLYAIVMGPTTLDDPQPHLTIHTFSILFFLIGGVVIIGMQAMKKLSEQKDA